MIDRRTLLQAGLCGIAAPSLLGRLAFAAPDTKKVLVVVMLRGAVDGLSVVAPCADDSYYAARPTIAVARPDDTAKPEAERLLRLDDRFGLHPAMQPLHRAFSERRLAFVHAAGSPAATRSHFDAQDYMESGTPDRKATEDGFLNRLLASSAKAADTELRAIAVTNAMPRIMSGQARAVVFSTLGDLSLGQGKGAASTGASFEAMYAAAVHDVLHGPTQEVFDVARQIEKAGVTKMKPENGAVYPKDAFGRSLSEIAALIRANLGVQIAFTDIGGWDTHASQGGATGQLAKRLDVLAKSLDAFAIDLGKRMDDVVVVAMSEFGRTVRENGSRGTDHGHGNVMLVAHGGVRGGKVYGTWPGLGEGQRFEGRDLAVTTDFREVLWQVAAKHLRATNRDVVFPGFTPVADASALALF
ncbi:MAG: DUF1501 domain-containing protein [Myxococcota bacterium]|nr:DUF1501 domain-containing protein [Myxococcota bacterium]